MADFNTNDISKIIDNFQEAFEKKMFLSFSIRLKWFIILPTIINGIFLFFMNAAKLDNDQWQIHVMYVILTWIWVFAILLIVFDFIRLITYVSWSDRLVSIDSGITVTNKKAERYMSTFPQNAINVKIANKKYNQNYKIRNPSKAELERWKLKPGLNNLWFIYSRPFSKDDGLPNAERNQPMVPNNLKEKDPATKDA